MARTLARGGMEGVQVISLERAAELLTPKRREIVEELAVREFDSVRGLARELDRDKGQVIRDLAALAEGGVVTFESDGRSKRPKLVQAHVVEPIV